MEKVKCDACNVTLLRARRYVTEYSMLGSRFYPRKAFCKSCYYKQLKCSECSEGLTKNTCEYAVYNLKRGAKMPPVPYCSDCYQIYLEENKDDLCEVCGDNSLGSSPCSRCRQNY
jgi:hypothetical protein